MTVVLIWRWILKIGSYSGAIIASLILGCDWVILFHTPLIIAETLLTFLLLLAIQATWDAINSPQPRQAMGAGLLWSLSAITKPVSILLPLALSPFFYSQKKKICIFLFLLTAYLPPTLWMIRNYYTSGYLALTSQAGFDLFTHPASAIEAYSIGKGWGDTRTALTNQIELEHPGGYRNEFEKSKVYQQAALKIFINHPFLLVRLSLIGAGKLLAGTGLEMLPQMLPGYQPLFGTFSIHASGNGTFALLHRYPALIPVQILYMCALVMTYFLFVIGLSRLWQQKMKTHAIFLGLGAFYFLAVASHQGYYRFRIPMIPFLAVGTAAAFGGLRPSTKQNIELHAE